VEEARGWRKKKRRGKRRGEERRWRKERRRKERRRKGVGVDGGRRNDVRRRRGAGTHGQYHPRKRHRSIRTRPKGMAGLWASGWGVVGVVGEARGGGSEGDKGKQS
jgi:hypothetical protein